MNRIHKLFCVVALVVIASYPVSALPQCSKPLCQVLAEQAFQRCLTGGGDTDTCTSTYQDQANACAIFCI